MLPEQAARGRYRGVDVFEPKPMPGPFDHDQLRRHPGRCEGVVQYLALRRWDKVILGPMHYGERRRVARNVGRGVCRRDPVRMVADRAAHETGLR